MRTGILLEEAQQILLEKVHSLQTSCVTLFEAVGRILSQDIQAKTDLPPFNRSPLDGYALQARDTAEADTLSPVSLAVIEEVPAGYMPRQKVTAGTAIKIMTGAPIPEGADVVIKYEDVEWEQNTVRLFHKLKAGSNIVLTGEDVVKGEIIAKQGSRLTPPLVGVLAAQGFAEVPVVRKPKVAILSTGDEVIDPSEALHPGKIYNSNMHSLCASCIALGAEPLPMGIVPDNKQLIAEKISHALGLADIVITTGGVSVGDYDAVPDALKELSADLLFWKIEMKPGSPVVAAVHNNKLIIGLSGNPAAALITFDLVVVPLIKKMLGQDRHLPLTVPVVLANGFYKSSPQRRFLRAQLYRKNRTVYAKLTGEQGNGALKSMIDCNALIDVNAGSGPLTAGEHGVALILDSSAEILSEEAIIKGSNARNVLGRSKFTRAIAENDR
ncbi:gephyrin-like molybdotransferase Glp [Sporomusa sp.]|uniref:molybdopterin molybdotransferase MoeA n=1 Tax=Sporomusa sp. TaxID=2078658 RepID=UPI002BF8397A|nr:gephyrin-like molybdotransferase Glp [Sporomusa sp.]HWR45518.1 gephyrin-like molybdotransferase Glp [Sporomusa sp.]